MFKRKFSKNSLRAAVLGANDGIVSVGSLIVGVASASHNISYILLAGLAATVAGALSMAAGEFSSVKTQSEVDEEDLIREKQQLIDHPTRETKLLFKSYLKSGIPEDLAQQVADRIMTMDTLEQKLTIHAREHLGISSQSRVCPICAAISSGASFTFGSIIPLLVGVLSHANVYATAAACFASLILTGFLSAKFGELPICKSVIRTVLWGMAALTATIILGTFF